jgi:hypothetical protein
MPPTRALGIPEAGRVMLRHGRLCQVVGKAGRALPTASSIANPTDAPVAQLDRVFASEAKGRAFESRRAHQFHK